jgi:hypothetical protein
VPYPSSECPPVIINFVPITDDVKKRLQREHPIPNAIAETVGREITVKYAVMCLPKSNLKIDSREESLV